MQSGTDGTSTAEQGPAPSALTNWGVRLRRTDREDFCLAETRAWRRCMRAAMLGGRPILPGPLSTRIHIPMPVQYLVIRPSGDSEQARAAHAEAALASLLFLDCDSGADTSDRGVASFLTWLDEVYPEIDACKDVDLEQCRWSCFPRPNRERRPSLGPALACRGHDRGDRKARERLRLDRLRRGGTAAG
jgi:hypothetical protein